MKFNRRNEKIKDKEKFSKCIPEMLRNGFTKEEIKKSNKYRF